MKKFILSIVVMASFLAVPQTSEAFFFFRLFGQRQQRNDNLQTFLILNALQNQNNNRGNNFFFDGRGSRRGNNSFRGNNFSRGFRSGRS